MKACIRCLAVLSTAFLTLRLAFSPALGQGTAFTYQGQLKSGGALADGSYDFSLLLYDAATGGSILAGPVTNTAVSVSNGLFTMTVDFGPGVFVGGSNWLHIGVSTHGSGAFTGLSPRQQLEPAPYAIFAETVNVAGLTGSVPEGDLSGIYTNALNFNNPGNSFSGNGAVLTNVNAKTLGGLGPNRFWQTTGNSGTTPGPNFVGTTDNQPLELHVNGSRVWRLEPAALAPNLVGGYFQNVIAGAQGATISGGGASNYINQTSSDLSTIAGGSPPRILKPPSASGPTIKLSAQLTRAASPWQPFRA